MVKYDVITLNKLKSCEIYEGCWFQCYCQAWLISISNVKTQKWTGADTIIQMHHHPPIWKLFNISIKEYRGVGKRMQKEIGGGKSKYKEVPRSKGTIGQDISITFKEGPSCYYVELIIMLLHQSCNVIGSVEISRCHYAQQH